MSKCHVADALEAMSKLTARAHGKEVLITGDTTPLKDLLKSQGGNWNNVLTGWIFQGSKKKAVLGALRSAGHDVTDDTIGRKTGSALAATPRQPEPEPAAKKQKTGICAVAAAAGSGFWSRPLTPREPDEGTRKLISVRKFNGSLEVDIREWYGDASDPKRKFDGVRRIALHAEEWNMLKQALPEIDAELKRLQDT